MGRKIKNHFLRCAAILVPKVLRDFPTCIRMRWSPDVFFLDPDFLAFLLGWVFFLVDLEAGFLATLGIGEVDFFDPFFADFVFLPEPLFDVLLIFFL
jgi:hypothetical protein